MRTKTNRKTQIKLMRASETQISLKKNKTSTNGSDDLQKSRCQAVLKSFIRTSKTKVRGCSKSWKISQIFSTAPYLKKSKP